MHSGDYWWKRAVTTLTTTASQSYIALPPDHFSFYTPYLYRSDVASGHRIAILRNEKEFEDHRAAYAQGGEPSQAIVVWKNDLDSPTGVLELAPTPNLSTYAYRAPYRRKASQLGTVAAISAVSKAATAVVTTATAHGLVSGERVYISDVVGMTQLNGRGFWVTVSSTTQFSLYSDQSRATAVDSTAYTTYASGGYASRIWPGLPTHWGPAWITETCRRMAIGVHGRETQQRFDRLAQQAMQRALAMEELSPYSAAPDMPLDNYADALSTASATEAYNLDNLS